MLKSKKPHRLIVPCFALASIALLLAIHHWPARVRAAQDPAPTRPRRQSPELPNTFSVAFPSSPNAPSATITVNSLADGAPANNGQCTLREALINANNNNQSGSTDCTAGSGADTINISVTGTINLTGVLPDIAESLTISGPGATQLAVRRDTGGDYRIFQVNSGTTVNISGLTITNGKLDFGGGINNNGTLTITDCALTSNTASINGGGVNSSGTLTIIRSTISGNTSGDGAVFTNGPLLTVVNSTISGNTATAFTGGITHVNFGGPTTNVIVTNSTIANNTGPTEGGIATVAQPDPAVTTLRSNILANSSNPNISQVNPGASVVSQGNNLASDNGSGLLTAGGDLINTNPLLAPLGNYGGPTQTHLLLASSPARNAGNNSGGLGTDQRGYPRVVGGVPDIGAVEDDISLTINPATLPNNPLNQSYNQQLSVSGTTGATTTWTISSGSAPTGVTLNPSTGLLSGMTTANGTFNFTVIASSSNGAAGVRSYTVIVGAGSGGLQFYPLPAPVRLLETRPGFTGCTNPGGAITATTTFTLPARTGCSGVPISAAAITGNVTVVPSGPGFITMFPSDAAQPTVANSNFKTGEITNNVFTVGLGNADGALKIFASATTHVIIDVTGYYAPPAAGGLYFHPLPSPVRLVETRTFSGATGCILKGSKLTGTGNPNADPSLDYLVQGRSPVASPCNSIPATAQVLVGNATTVLPSGGGYLTIYPSDAARPTVASSNYAGADIINGPFAVRLGSDGKFKVYTFATTDLVIDILGYYSTDATDTNGAGLFFNQIPHPVRLLETRPGFSGCVATGFRLESQTTLYNLRATDTCEAIGFSAARAIVGNATVVTPDHAGYMTFAPFNQPLPTVATSNFVAGGAYNRHFFVGLDAAEGKFNIFFNMSNPSGTVYKTDLVIDVSGYFAP